MKTLILLASVALLVGVYLHQQFREIPGPLDENIPPEEEAFTSQLIHYTLSMVDSSHDRRAPQGDKLYHRDVHAKAHGLIRATFRALPNLAPEYRYGVFRNPPADGYKAWIRFSSGDPAMKPDSSSDVHGMAVKLMGIPGPKLLPGEEQAETQDFVMISHYVFPARNIDEYGELLRYSLAGNTNAYFFAGGSPNPLKWRLRELVIAAKTLRRAPSSVLNAQYFSASAYKLGPDHNIKFSTRPCSKLPVPPGIGRSDPEFLRAVLKEQLKTAPACFDFLVQTQRRDKYMPVEDPSVEWSEKDAPFVPVAKIEIPAQEFASPAQDILAENLSFNAWHALPDHRPLGGLNRVRKAVYQQVSRYRRCKNGIALAEPSDWSLTLSGQPCQLPPAPASTR